MKEETLKYLEENPQEASFGLCILILSFLMENVVDYDTDVNMVSLSGSLSIDEYIGTDTSVRASEIQYLALLTRYKKPGLERYM